MSELAYMAGMRTTAEIEADLDRVRRAPSEIEQRIKIPWLEGCLVKAKRRDEIQETRPVGCWCLGAGEPKGDAFCGCAEGQIACEKARQEELALRELWARERWKAAEVPPRFTSCTLDNFPGPGLEQVRAWLNSDGKESLLLHGRFGVGKTGLAVGALRVLIDEYGAGLFITVPSLLDRIRATYDGKGDEAEKALISRVQTVPVLVLDDIGAERVTEWVAEKLFTVINARHDNLRATIFTSNLDPKQLAGHVGERTAWRIIEMCEVVKLDGPNLRDKR